MKIIVWYFTFWTLLYRISTFHCCSQSCSLESLVQYTRHKFALSSDFAFRLSGQDTANKHSGSNRNDYFSFPVYLALGSASFPIWLGLLRLYWTVKTPFPSCSLKLSAAVLYFQRELCSCCFLHRFWYFIVVSCNSSWQKPYVVEAI